MNDLEEILHDKLLEKQKEVFELQDENEKLHNIIKEVREYVKEKYDYVLGDETFLDHDELVDRRRMKYILEILERADNDNKR